MSLSSIGREIFAISPGSGDVGKDASCQRRWRMAARASLKVSCGLGYQAARRGGGGLWAKASLAQTVTSENKPNKAEAQQGGGPTRRGPNKAGAQQGGGPTRRGPNKAGVVRWIAGSDH